MLSSCSSTCVYKPQDSYRCKKITCLPLTTKYQSPISLPVHVLSTIQGIQPSSIWHVHYITQQVCEDKYLRVWW